MSIFGYPKGDKSQPTPQVPNWRAPPIDYMTD